LLYRRLVQLGQYRYWLSPRIYWLALELNGGNVKFTAQQLNLPRKTLATWKDGDHINDDVVSIRHNKTQELANKFEDLANIYID
jgi:hypothetical protein